MSKNSVTVTRYDRKMETRSQNHFHVPRRFLRRGISLTDIDDTVRNILDPVGTRVYPTVNYDNVNILLNFTTRYSTNAFARMKIGEALAEKKLTPHMYESKEEAQKALKPEN